MTIHVHPEADDSHQLEWVSCWCDPRVDFLDPDTELPYPQPLVIHEHPAGNHLTRWCVTVT